MPMSRYEIRNEYSLADPELYRTADKDDPEALLEGVAMAGLVGVLRQLGDLAEFAAEIFHNLHEEVMATAARGHGLMIRVQQLETEVPSIERAFLSQTDHSSFFYHAGLDWHPNLRVDQNLITQGDLPRFIMDSYEECRAPPRLFLLDKFDVAGAGACLKRYTDPSFFKVETSGVTGLDVQREKKIRKGKKKGPRWRNGGTPDILPTSHAKLHQLFLEERVENGVSAPSHRAKLKRKLNGFPFNSKTGKSYMEKILNSTSPDHKVLYEVNVNSSPLMLATNDSNKSGLEVRSVSPDRGSVGGKRSPPSSPDREEIMLNHTRCEQREIPIDDNISKAPDSYPNIATDGISSTLIKVDGEKVISVDAESSREGSITGYQSDAISSEVENYVDAPSTIESEMDTDRELKVKSSFTSSHIKDQPLISEANEEDRQTRSSDAQSTGDSTISDDGNNSSRKEVSSFYSSDSPNSSAENQESEIFSGKCSPSADNPEVEIIGGLSYQKTDNEDFPVDQHPMPVVSDAITNHRSEVEQLTSSLCTNESISASQHSDSGVEEKDMLNRHEADEIASTLEDEEKKTNLVIGPPCSSIVSDVESQSGGDSPRSCAGEQVNEPNSDIQCHARDSSVTMSLDLLHEDTSDPDDRDPAENIASTLNMSNAPSQITNSTPEMVSSENPIPGKLDDESPKLPENLDELDHEDSDVSIDGPDRFPCNMEDSLGTKPEDTSSANVQTVDAEDNHSNSSMESPKLPENLDELDHEDSDVSTDCPDRFPCNMEDSLGTKPKDTSSANVQTVDAKDNHSNSSMESPKLPENLDELDHEDSDFSIDGPDRFTCDMEDSFGTKPEDTSSANVQAVDAEDNHSNSSMENQIISENLISSYLADSPEEDRPLQLETFHSCEVEGLEGIVITDSEALESSFSAVEGLKEPPGTSDTEISGSADLKSMNEVRVLLDESESEADMASNTVDMASALPAVSDNAIIDSVCSLEDQQESGQKDEVGQTKATTSGFENGYHPESEVSDSLPNSHHDLEVEFVHAASFSETEDKIFQESGSGNHVSDAPPSWHVDYDFEQSLVQEKISVPPSQIDDYGEIRTDLSPSLPFNHQEMPDHDEGDNDSTSTFSFIHCESPHSNDPLSSIFPPSNPFSETNQINLGDLAPLPPLPPVQWRMGKLQHAEAEMTNHKEIFRRFISPPTPSNDDVHSSPPPASTDEVKTLLEETKQPPTQIAPGPASKEEKVDNGCSGLEANFVHETIEPPPERENKPASDNGIKAISEEDGVANGRQMAKLPRPRNPLVEDVAALDKSKLRKVTERIRPPQIQKVDERDTLLEQIRTKSFNLRPAMASRPSIRGPNTNLNVAAILEKANSIRQAFVGSDEDDDDSWSDS